MVNLFHLLLLALLGSIIALIGGVAFLFNRKWSDILEKHSIPFAAGILITVSLVGLLPESVELLGENAYKLVLATFLSAYLFEHTFFGIHHHGEHRHGKDYKSAIPLVLIGDTIHNFIDGIAIGASYMVTPGLGLITAISTFLHEVPHEIGDFGILLNAGWNRNKILTLNVISASSTIVGAFLVLTFSENNSLIGAMLSVASGIFLYLLASDFLPHIDEIKGSRLKHLMPLIIGALLMLVTLMAIPHSD